MNGGAGASRPLPGPGQRPGLPYFGATRTISPCRVSPGPHRSAMPGATSAGDASVDWSSPGKASRAQPGGDRAGVGQVDPQADGARFPPPRSAPGGPAPPWWRRRRPSRRSACGTIALVTNTARPASGAASSGPQVRISRQVAVRLTAITSSQSLGRMCAHRREHAERAGVARPGCRAGRSARAGWARARRASAPSRRSSGSSVALPPAARMASSISSSPPWVRAVMHDMRACGGRVRRAAAAPMPRLAPVTRATRPASGPVSGHRFRQSARRSAGDCRCRHVGQRDRVIAGEAGVAVLRLAAGRGRACPSAR